MSDAQGPNIAEWQAQQQHQEANQEKSGFGLGHSDSIATITEGLKWFFNFHEGAIAAYNNIFEGLIAGASLATLFGKSGNMFGIKIFEGLAEHFSGGGDGDATGDGDHAGGAGGGDANGDEGIRPEDYPHTSDQMASNAEGLHGAHDAGEHRDQFFSPGPSPSVGDDHHHGQELGS